MLRTGVPVCTMKGNDYIGGHERSLVKLYQRHMSWCIQNYTTTDLSSVMIDTSEENRCELKPPPPSVGVYVAQVDVQKWLNQLIILICVVRWSSEHLFWSSFRLGNWNLKMKNSALLC